ncbi:asparagine synthase (glutamine-hydrolyzing) [Bacillus shivajii]|uniref:asparagine synthase (glutamine-hydrolyzing) n=1 Tax=Bacillus shivajii TaxID=1983719 RepID=UPI001CFA2ABB|nr:asparagine synthase (glutamine-hydrolyzing) [Bacillus shivajii]UCZ52665.1 asparagine synthase (glutamine-hydrolyzing) [Bacillus shivajii]
MCGFVGIATTKQDILYKLPIEKMTSVIHHRGPDDKGIYESDYVRFGFQRLSIVDLDGGQQPMSTDDRRYTIIFNGEIYNTPELREWLQTKGVETKTHSDTEVILHLYKKKGENCVDDLRGMFSFLIWDAKDKVLFGARDPFGIKPLYYKQFFDGTILFSSEKKSLFFENKRSYIYGEGAFHYLTFQYVPEPFTATSSIKKVKPGSCFTWKPDHKLQFKQYWKPTFTPEKQRWNPFSVFTKTNKENHLQNIAEALKKSVEQHLRSDVPVGAFLSGGIDSSAIVSIAKQYHPDIRTFTAEFERDGYSEADVAAETAKALGVNHERISLSAEDVMNELPKIIWHMDEPVADPAAIPLYFVAKKASEHVKVVLSGEGADELFGGYNIYREPQSLRLFRFVPDMIKPHIRKFAEQLPYGMKGRSFLMRGCHRLEDRFVGNAKIFTDEEKSHVLFPRSPGWKTGDVLAPLYEEARINHYDDVTTMQHIDLHTWLRGDILVKADKMTMAHSLELRVPFLDREVFKAAVSLPIKGKVHGKQTKVWLREALRDIVPEHVLNRKKLGFPVPIKHWLKDEMYEWARNWMNQSQTEHIFNKDACLNMLDMHRAGKIEASRKIWTILTYMIWHNQFIENEKKDRSHNNII